MKSLDVNLANQEKSVIDIKPSMTQLW